MASQVGHVTKNRNVIGNAFGKWSTSIGEAIEDAMWRTLQAGVQFALDAHDDHHRNHLKIGDSYGIALLRHGTVIRLDVKTYENNTGGVARQLIEEASSIKDDYVGIIMAGLNPPSYFVLDYEEDILAKTQTMTDELFKRLFREK